MSKEKVKHEVYSFLPRGVFVLLSQVYYLTTVFVAYCALQENQSGEFWYFIRQNEDRSILNWNKTKHFQQNLKI